MKRSVLLFLTAIALFAVTSTASTLVEVPDVGQLPGTAALVPGGTLNITGTISGDADLWKFYWGGGGFYANTVGSTPAPGYTRIDTQLFLFDANGLGIQGNDDGISYAGPAYLQLAN